MPDAISPAPSAPPVFIVGCGRSGTTMLRLMLDAHPELAIPGETHFLMALWKHRDAYLVEGHVDAEALAGDAMRTHQFGYWGVPQEAVLRRVGALVDPGFGDVLSAVYMTYADQHGKRRWGDKTPQYVRSMRELSGIFAGARFIHVIRDGRDVALSYLSLEWGPPTVWRAAHVWRSDVTAGRSAGRALGPQRYLELRYEDLVRNPEDELRRACAFLGMAFDPVMLEYHRDAEKRIHARPDTVRSHASATRPPTVGLRDWRTEMTEQQVEAFESVAGRLLAELGYEPRFRRMSFLRRARGAVRSRMVKPRLPAGPKIRTAPRRERGAEGAEAEGAPPGNAAAGEH
jgi:Sulfotransferase family